MTLADLLTDPTVDRWTSLAPEKIDHVVYGFALWVLLGGCREPWRPVLFLGLAIAWELLELTRYLVWRHKGFPVPRPEICDRFSYKDVLRDALGALAAVFLVVGPHP